MTPESIKLARKIIAAGRIDCFDNISCEELQDFAKAARTILPQALDEIERLIRSQCEYDMDLAKLGKDNDNLRCIIDDELSSGNVYVSTLKEQLRAAEQERDRLAAEVNRLNDHNSGKFFKEEYEKLDRQINSAAELLAKEYEKRFAVQKKLEETIELWADDRKELQHQRIVAQGWFDKLQASAAREKVLVEALEFYADDNSWQQLDEREDGLQWLAGDGGARARAALEKK